MALKLQIIFIQRGNDSWSQKTTVTKYSSAEGLLESLRQATGGKNLRFYDKQAEELDSDNSSESEDEPEYDEVSVLGYLTNALSEGSWSVPDAVGSIDGHINRLYFHSPVVGTAAAPASAGIVQRQYCSYSTVYFLETVGK